MAKSLSAEKGRDLLKQVRTHLIETARPVMVAMAEVAMTTSFGKNTLQCFKVWTDEVT